jgi:hypothetical protein
MKKTLITLAGLLAIGSSAHAAALVAIGAATLTLENGNPLPDGTLIQVVGSFSDASFGGPTPGSFVGETNDDVVLASFLLNSNTFGSLGGFVQDISLNYAAGAYAGRTLVAGTPLLLRWWPSKNLSTIAPQALDRFGEFRTDSVADGSSRGWTAPADGATESFNFLTENTGGSQPNLAGRAGNVVPVPEPTSTAMLVAGLACFALRRRRA